MNIKFYVSCIGCTQHLTADLIKMKHIPQINISLEMPIYSMSFLQWKKCARCFGLKK